MFRRQAGHSAIRPLHVVRGGHGVDIEDRLPGGFWFSQFFERGAPVDAPRVLGVPPEVVQMIPAFLHSRNAGARVQDLEGLRVEFVEDRLGPEPFGSPRVLLLDPVHRSFGVDRLEPEMGVVRCVGRSAGAQQGQEEGESGHERARW